VGLAAPNLTELGVAKRNQDRQKGAAMEENTLSQPVEPCRYLTAPAKVKPLIWERVKLIK
jgi:hypothetical protein